MTSQVIRIRRHLLLSSATAALMVVFGPAHAQTVDFSLDSGAVGTASAVDRGTVSVTTQELTGAVLSSIVDGGLAQSSSGAVDSSAVDISANALLANARGNSEDTQGQLLGDAADGRIGLLTGQVASNTVMANINDSTISAVLSTTNNATGSSFVALGNQIDARATVNNARTVFADDIEANLGSLLASDTTAVATATLTRGDFNTQLVDVDGASSVVANSQVMTDNATASTATANDNAILLDLTDGTTSSDAINSALAIDRNQIRAALTGNTAVAGTDLSVDTGFGGTGVVLNQQQIGDGTDTIALTAIADSNALSVDLTEETESSVSVTQNVIGTSTIGNTTRDGAGAGTFLFVDANQITTNGEEANVSLANTDVLSLDGAFVAGTQQQILDSAGGMMTLTSTNTDSTMGVTTANVVGSVVDIARNTLFATAKGNDAVTAIGLSGTSVDASAALGNQQSVVGSVMATLGNSTDPSVFSATVDGTLTDASVGIANNVLLGQSEANVARNQLSVTSDTEIAQTSPNSRAALINPDRANAGFVLGSDQSVGDATKSVATTVNTDILATIGTGAAVGDIDRSSVSISGNGQVAITMVNQSVNTLDLAGLTVGDVGNNEAASSILLSLQDITALNVTSASTLDLTLDQVNYTTGAGALSIVDSLLAVNGNKNRSTVTGNEASNRVTTSADTAIVGNIGNATRSSFVATSRATSILGNTQSATADSLDADATTNATLESNNTAGEVGIENSSLSIGENLTVAESNGNIATSVLQQSAGTETGATAGLRNVQDLNVASNTANAVLQLTYDTRGSSTNSSLAIDENRIFATAKGNIAQNDVIADATAISGSTVGTEYFAGFLGNVTDGATASFALASDQTQAGTTSATAEVDALAVVRGTAANGGFLDQSVASIDGTTARADALANEASNRVSLDATAEGKFVTAGIASRQQSSGGINARVETTGANESLQIGIRRGLVDSSMTVDRSGFVASATANTIENRLSVQATLFQGGTSSLTPASPDTNYSALGALLDGENGLLSATSDVAIANFQETQSSDTITASVNVGGDVLSQDFGFLRSNASVSNSIAQADGQANEAVNVLTILADTAAAASAIANVQQNIANVDVDSIFTGTVNVANTLATDGSGLNASSVNVNGNISLALASANFATSNLFVDATSFDGLSIDGEAAFAAIPLPGSSFTRVRADNVVASQQSSDSAISANSDSDIVAFVRGDIDVSAASISGNIGQSSAIVNRASNAVTVDAATDVNGTAAVANEQLGSGNVDASTNVRVIFRQNIEDSNVNPPSIVSSSIGVNDNVSVSGARGNDATNSIAVVSALVNGRNINSDLSITDGVITGLATNTSGNLLANSQSRTGIDIIAASSDITANVLVNSDNGLGTDTVVDTPSTLTDSSVSISGNIADSTVGANKVNNTVALNSDTKLQTSAGLVNAQSSDNSVTSDVQITARVGTNVLGDVTNSSVALNANVGVVRANGNEAVNRMSALSSTEVAGASTAGGSARLTAGLPTVLNAQADYAMLNNQTNSGSVTAQASTAGAQTILSSATGGTLLNSSVSLSQNALVADASSNRSDNRMTVSGRAPSENVTVVTANRQIATGAVTSRVDTFRVSSVSADITSSTVRIGGNQFNASASGNIGSMGLIRD
jgi:hypothetical protein